MPRKPVNPADVAAAKRSIRKRVEDARRRGVPKGQIRKEVRRSVGTLRKFKKGGEWRLFPPYS
ncbi:MAG: hypothetical protein NTZ73_02880 [Candidatus Diapherotrites archaeon]|nr:hypothetical protein [Candidatus Diapherotrites archaeon]